MKLTNKNKKRKQRKLSSKPVKGNLARPRLVAFKSNRRLIVQVINDEKGHTLIYLCCRKSKEEAAVLGQTLVEKLKEKGIKQIVSDRNGYPYHGVIEALCCSVRKGGINF